MSLPLLIGLALVLLFLPWALMPRRPRRPEIHGGLRALWWINAFYCALVHRLVVNRTAPLPAHGAAILIANHTCGIDNMILQAGCQRVLGFMIAQEFYDFWLCWPFCRLLQCIPVRRDGHDVAATRAALRALADGRVLPIFPEGRITPRSGCEFGEPKPGAAYIALRSGAPVIPAYIRGTPTTNNVFKALASLSNARVFFGDPIDLADLERPCGHATREQLQALAERLMNEIKALRERSLAAER